jgi:hypothetical protein
MKGSVEMDMTPHDTQDRDIEQVRDATADPLTPYIQEHSGDIIKEHN